MNPHLKLVHDADAPVHIVHQRFGSPKRSRDIDVSAYQRELERETVYIIALFSAVTLAWTAFISWAIWSVR